MSLGLFLLCLWRKLAFPRFIYFEMGMKFDNIFFATSKIDIQDFFPLRTHRKFSISIKMQYLKQYCLLVMPPEISRNFQTYLPGQSSELQDEKFRLQNNMLSKWGNQVSSLCLCIFRFEDPRTIRKQPIFLSKYNRKLFKFQIYVTKNIANESCRKKSLIGPRLEFYLSFSLKIRKISTIGKEILSFESVLTQKMSVLG